VSTLDHQPLSPLDGRYRKAVGALGEYLSEAGLNRARVHIEVEWLIFLTDEGLFGTHPMNDAQKAGLRRLVTDFDQSSIDELAELEAVRKHDVKSVEVFIRRHLPALGLADHAELVHIACTSEDVNNLSYATIVRDAMREVWLPRARALVERLGDMATEYAEVPLLSHTHGQPATPSTMGKELAVFVHRLSRQLAHIERQDYLGKFNGATGTYAAHVVADPTADWPDVSRRFVEGLGLTWNPLTTQIESHDWQAELYHTVELFNSILHNLATDMWTYISMGYFHQIPVAGEVGSSTMPHKINPIRFENAEANLELSNALLGSLASTLVTSRMQRDLTDSTTQRNIGVALGHSLLAIDNLVRGLGHRRARPRHARRRSGPQLGGARRGDPDGHPRRGGGRPLAHRRPLHPTQRPHPRPPGDTGRPRGVRLRARHRRRGETAPVRPAPGDLHRPGRAARDRAVTPSHRTSRRQAVRRPPHG
jgi:adenylosuccinate lyase